ncbi:MAG: helix-turn-helix domain-containing protein [Paracoccaceae bacterium]|nr:helix-turn-helix domain-containing protein [Paracoccaceae bacterium]
MTKDAPTKPTIESTLSKGLAILENLPASRKGKGVTALSKEMGFTKSNTFRLLQTLITSSYVKHSPDKSNAAILKTWQVGRDSVDSLNLREMSALALLHLS